MRLIDADALKAIIPETETDIFENCQRCTTLMDYEVKDLINEQPTIPAPRWVRCEDRLPDEAGEYIVAYHPCWWDDVKTQVTKVGMDSFRGKASWAKKKFQRVTTLDGEAGAAEGGRMTTRHDLVKDMEDAETILLALDGLREDIPDKTVIRAIMSVAHSGIHDQEGQQMTDEYKRFVRQLKAATAGMTFEQIADALNVGQTTVRSYYRFDNVMSGETMLKAIRLMGGYKC